MQGAEWLFDVDAQSVSVKTVARWDSSPKAVDKGMHPRQRAANEPADHFAGIGKMVDSGFRARREIADIALLRYACHLIAQDCDPSQDQIAFAQTGQEAGTALSCPSRLDTMLSAKRSAA